MWKREGLFSISLVSLLIISGMTALISIPDDILPFTLSNKACASFAGGNGSADNPYQISNVIQLQDIKSNLTAHYEIINDINASVTTSWNGGNGFYPIGSDSSKFSGSLDGRRYNISNFYTKPSTDSQVGLFGYITTGAIIINVSLININVIGGVRVGGLVGFKEDGTVSNCSVSGNVTGQGGLVGYNNNGMVYNCSMEGNVIGHGGLVGYNGGTISNCFAAVNVTRYSDRIGGLIGLNYDDGTVTNCYATGKVSGENYVGGLIGENRGDSIVINCYATGNVSGNLGLVGGLIGKNEGSILKCYAKGNVITIQHSAGANYVGGLVGYNILGSTISNCYATGNVSGGYHIGGLLGHNIAGNIWNSYATGNVSGLKNYVGGLVGYHSGNNYGGLISNCYSTGSVSGDNYVGGLVGENFLGTVSNSFWDTETSGTIISDDGNGRNTSQMKTRNTFTSVGWDFIRTWYIIENISYPSLIKIDDIEKPVFGIDLTPISGNTGDSFIFNISISDNFYVSSVQVEYWYGTESHANVSMSGYSFYIYNILVPTNSTDTLHYIFHVNDSANNWNETLQKDVNITDNDRPVFGIDSTPINGTTGDSLTFNITVLDNINVQNVTVEYWYGTGTHINSTISGNESYTLTISILSNSTDTLHYIFHANDSADNWNETTQNDVNITDNDRSVFGMDFTPGYGTTGDPLTFNITIWDNIGVQTVTVEYWFGTGTHTNSTMSGVGPYLFTISIPSDSTYTLYYIFHACDGTGNWNETLQKNVIITDNDRPIFGIDSTLGSGTTGDSMTLNITVLDNIGVQTVTVEYWYGTGTHINTTMFGIGPYSLTILIPSDSTSTLHYIFHTCDNAGNWNETSQKNIILTDNDRPTFGMDSTPVTGTTGDPLTFSIAVLDNIDVQNVTVEYWFGIGEHINATMSGIGPYSCTVLIPSDSKDSLHYIFHACDGPGNWNETSQKDVIISDNDMPVFGMDSTLGSGTTGDSFTFNISVSDNVGIDHVILNYWFENEYYYTYVTLYGSSPYTHIISIPDDSTDTLHYIFKALDSSDNLKEISQKDVIITDNDVPTYGNDSTPCSGTNGDSFTFNISVSDNVGIHVVILEYWFGDRLHQKVEMVQYVDRYTITLSIPMNSTDSLNYNITALDVSGLLNTTEIKTIEVIDDISPEVQPVDDFTLYAGDTLHISINATDNVGISDYIWEDIPVPASGGTLSGVPSETGTFILSVTVYDDSENAASITFTITVLPIDNDKDGDGIPDLIEKANGLDINDSNDASLDPDNDGLTNLEEFLNGTDMRSNDTDRDGMPDRWEIDNGLDALNSSADNDADGDGKTDLEEYLDGTDPNVKEGSDGGLSWVVALITLFIVVALLLGLGAFIYMKRRKNVEELQEVEEQAVDPVESDDLEGDTQEDHENLDVPDNDVPADSIPEVDQNIPIQETLQEPPQLYEDGIPDQVVPGTDSVSLVETPVEEQMSDEIPLESSEQTTMVEDLSTDNGPY